MLNIKKRSKTLIVAFLLLATLLSSFTALPVFAANETTGSSASNYDAGKAYYNAKYEYLQDTESVFQSITWEEAVYLFQQEGNYLILLGGSWCPNTTAVVDYINEAAKAVGVTTVYNLDLVLDGNVAKDIGGSKNAHVRETNSSTKDGANYNYLYGELVTKYLTNLNDWVEYTRYAEVEGELVDNESALTYTNSDGVEVTVPKVQVPFLFLYNKDNTVDNSGKEQNNDNYSTTYPIVYGFEKMVYRDENGLFEYNGGINRVTEDEYKAALNSAIFSHIGEGEGKVKLSSFTDADYIRISYNEKAGQTIFGKDDQINIRTITYDQLDWLLQQDGNYLILFGGSWCGNTKAVIKIINDYAVKNDLIVYNFDTKLDGGYAKAYWGYSKDLHIRDSENEFAYLYVRLVNTYLKNIETEYTVESGKYIYYQTDANDPSTKVIANKLQVPYFFAYNKAVRNDNGHSTPILSYVEKMYSLKESSSDYIGKDANYADYTSAAFGVVSAYAAKAGITAQDIVSATNNTANNSSNTENNTNNTENNTNNTQNNANNTGNNTDNNGNNDDNKNDNGTVVKIVVAIVAVVVVAGVVVFVVVKKKSSSGDDHCC